MNVSVTCGYFKVLYIIPLKPQYFGEQGVNAVLVGFTYQFHLINSEIYLPSAVCYSLITNF